ncbi:hypothetical protein Tco_0492563 [Tanacetum coccineum]
MNGKSRFIAILRCFKEGFWAFALTAKREKLLLLITKVYNTFLDQKEINMRQLRWLEVAELITIVKFVITRTKGANVVADTL